MKEEDDNKDLLDLNKLTKSDSIITFGELPDAKTIGGSDIFPGTQSGSDVQYSFSQAATYINGEVNLNTAYANTSYQNFNITSGLNVNGDNFTLFGSDGSETEISGSVLRITNPNDMGVNNNWSALIWRGQTTGTSDQFMGNFSLGFNYESVAGQESSFWVWEILNKGNVNVAMALMGADSIYGGTRLIIGGTDSTNAHVDNVSIGLGISGTPNSSALFEMHSTTQAFLPPVMTNSQFTSIPSAATGLLGYMSDYKAYGYFNGTDFDTVLSAGNIIEGSNFSITENGNGTYTYSASGSGGTVETGQANYTVSGNTTQTTFSNLSPTPLLLSSGSLTTGYQNNFTVNLRSGTIASVTNNNSVAKYCSINATITSQGTAAIPNNYTFWLYTHQAGGSDVQSSYTSGILLTATTGFLSTTLVGTLLLQSGDSAEIWISNSSNLNNILPLNISFQLIDTTETGGLGTTDNLAQGTSNLYLSQNGGTTYQNISGSLTPGNLVAGNTSGGQLIDSGISYSGSTITASITGNAATASAVETTFDNTNATQYLLYVPTDSTGNQTPLMNGFVTINPSTGLLNTAQVLVGEPFTPISGVNTKLFVSGTDSSNSDAPAIGLFTTADTYPEIVLFPFSHGDSALAFDAYYDGGWFSGYSGSNFLVQSLGNKLQLKYSSANAQGSAVTFTTGLYIDTSGNVNIPILTASQMIVTDASKNLASLPLPLSTNTLVTITTSTQSMSFQTRYVNNYTSGQMAGTLTTATGSGKVIELVSLTTASTSGWIVHAQSTDKIEFSGTLGASGGSLTSTSGSAIDCATFIDVAANLWVVYPALGLNMTVA